MSEKSLDTLLFRLIRFRQKVLTEFSPPLELFSLEEKATHVAGWPFCSGLDFLRRGAVKRCAHDSLNCLPRLAYLGLGTMVPRCGRKNVLPGIERSRIEGRQRRFPCTAMDVVPRSRPAKPSAVAAANNSMARSGDGRGECVQFRPRATTGTHRYSPYPTSHDIGLAAPAETKHRAPTMTACDSRCPQESR